jgi:DNA polymerase III sliding clamp (beta) subunit (PCNA family)
MSKIALPIAELKPALTGLAKVLNRKTTLPVLSHLKIERTKDGWIALTGTDLDRYATVRLEQPAEGAPCEFLVPLHDLQKTMKACAKADNIYLKPIGSEKAPSVIIQYPIGKELASSTVATVPVVEFPEIPRIEGEPIPLPDAIRTSLQEAMDCSSDDETRFILQSACIDVAEKGCHHVVGTNGRILYSSNSFSLPLESSLIIPKHPFLAWKEFNSDGEWQLKVGKDEGGSHPPPIQISTRRWQYVSKQIEGNYPNWRQVLINPQEAKSRFEFSPEILPAVIQTIQRMPCHDETNFTLGMELTGKTLRLLGKPAGPDAWIKVEAPIAKAKGKDVAVFVNRHLLMTALKFGLNTVEIIDCMTPIRLSNGGRQVIISPVRASVDAVAPATTEEEQSSGSEENGDGAAEPVNSGPANEPSTEGSPMANDTTTNGSKSTAPAGESGEPQPQVPASEVDQILEMIDDIRESLVTNLSDLKSITGKLKQIKRDQKSVEREMESFRHTLKSLQSVKLS